MKSPVLVKTLRLLAAVAVLLPSLVCAEIYDKRELKPWFSFSGQATFQKADGINDAVFGRVQETFGDTILDYYEGFDSWVPPNIGLAFGAGVEYDRLTIGFDDKPGKQVDLKDEEIRFLIDKSQAIIREQKMLVELEAPLHVCGDIHGQYYDLLRIFEHCGYPGEYNYLFLGDYVDRGKQSLETICLLLCYKIKYPDKVTLLRGNHESSVTNRIYGFYDECKRRYNVKLWKSFTELFNFLPVAALIDDKILCMHGGLSPDLKSINNITEIQRPTDIPDTGLLCDLLWSDPDKEATEYDENDRGVSVIFGEKVVTDFNKKNDLDLIIRAHQVVDDGYEFFANRQLITIFSAPNYCGEFDNSAGIMIIDDSLTCSLKVLRPVENPKK